MADGATVSILLHSEPKKYAGTLFKMKRFNNINGILAERNDNLSKEADILVIGAHNDDEMFPAGYLLNRINNGKKIGVAIATDGAGSSYQGVQGQALIDLRTEESRQAIEALGGVFFVGYQHPSALLKSDDGLTSFAEQLSNLMIAANPTILLIQSPTERHYTHLRTTEAALIAARSLTVSKPQEVWGYEVWTPLLALAADQMLQAGMFHVESLSPDVTKQKLELQARYKTQNEANPYHHATRAGNLVNKVMLDAHSAAGVGYSELFLDMSPLVHDGAFSDVTTVQFGGGLVGLAQYMLAHPKEKFDQRKVLDALIRVWIPAYKETTTKMEAYVLDKQKILRT